MLKFKSYLLSEVSLSGDTSRGPSRWDTYLVPDWTADTDYKLFTDGVLVLSEPATKSLKDFTISGPHSKGTKLQVISTELKSIGTKDFAKVHIDGQPQNGWIKISQIEKPAEVKEDGGILCVLGGTNSAEFKPEKINLNGNEYTSTTKLVSAISTGIKEKYGGEEYKEVRRYLSEFVDKIGGMPLTEASEERTEKSFTTTETFNVCEPDIKILSKNFGEVLGALYIIKTNKKIGTIGFPSNISQGLYDFYGIDGAGRTTYYSAKSGGGSSTSMANLTFITKNFSKDNSWLKDNALEMKVVNKLMNNPDRNTATNILYWFEKESKGLLRRILKIMSKGATISSLERADLAIWLNAMRKKKKGEVEFLSIMKDVYKTLEVGKKKPASTVAVLKDIFNDKKGKDYEGGYVIYPMGSHIVAYMNGDDVKRNYDAKIYKHRFIDCLDMLMNFGSFIQQITVDMEDKTTKIAIIKFSRNKFRFSYNGMTKKPNNRSIGFKEA